jgi:hypothetical protein
MKLNTNLNSSSGTFAFLAKVLLADWVHLFL